MIWPLTLRAIIAQQLIPTTDGNGRVAAIEVLLNSPMIAELIKKGEIGSIKEVMAKSKEMGMQTFDQALFDLYKQNLINYADALHHADSPNDLRLMIKLRNNEQQGAGFLQGVTVDALATIAIAKRLSMQEVSGRFYADTHRATACSGQGAKH